MALCCVMNRFKMTVAKTKELQIHSLKHLSKSTGTINPQHQFLGFAKYHFKREPNMGNSSESTVSKLEKLKNI